jgi:hypothetical protein
MFDSVVHHILRLEEVASGKEEAEHHCYTDSKDDEEIHHLMDFKVISDLFLFISLYNRGDKRHCRHVCFILLLNTLEIDRKHIWIESSQMSPLMTFIET